MISDSVDKRIELNKRSLDIRNSGNEKGKALKARSTCHHGLLHTYNAYDGGFIEAELQSMFPHVLQPSTLSTYYGFKSTNNTLQYFYSLARHKILTENVGVRQLKAITPRTDNRIIT